MGVLPIGFFAPLPLAIMIPFMAAQSFAMGDAFGTSFQYGKRKISSLSNKEFNELDMVSLHDTIQHDIRDMIPAMNQSFERMQEFQIDIINSMLQTLLLGIQEFGKFVTGGLGSSSGATTTETPEPSFGGTVIDDLTFGLLPSAFADTGDTDKKFVIDYIKEAQKLPFKLLASIVEKMLSGKLGKPIEKKIAYIQVYKQILAEKKIPLTTTKAIEKFTTKGSIVEQIAIKYNAIKIAFSNYQALKITSAKLKGKGDLAVNQAKSKWLKLTKSYNQFVQINKFPKMTIDIAKSMFKGKLSGKNPKKL